MTTAGGSSVVPGAGETGKAYTAYVTNLKSQSVTRIALGTDTAGIPIPSHSFPCGVAVTSDGATAYVTNRLSGTLTRIDTATNKAVGEPLGVGVNPSGVVLAPDGKTIYVGNEVGPGTVTRVDTATFKVVGTPIRVGTTPVGMAMATAPGGGTTLYVANQYGASVTPIDTKTGVAGEAIKVGVEPTGVAATPDGTMVFVTNRRDGTVTWIDTKTNKVGGTTEKAVFATPAGLVVAAVPGRGVMVYVVNAGRDSVTLMDATSHKVVTEIKVGRDPSGIAVTPDRTMTYVTNQRDNTVTPIETTTDKVHPPIPVGESPHLIAIAPAPAMLATGVKALAVRHMEITQAVQNLKNGVTLVARKATIVRVYLDPSGLDAKSATQVRGELTWKRGASAETRLPSMNVVALSGALKPTLIAQRHDVAASLNFSLPVDAVREGELTLWLSELRASGGEQIAMSGTTTASATFVAGPPLRIRVVGLRYKAPAVTVIPMSPGEPVSVTLPVPVKSVTVTSGSVVKAVTLTPASPAKPVTVTPTSVAKSVTVTSQSPVTSVTLTLDPAAESATVTSSVEPSATHFAYLRSYLSRAYPVPGVEWSQTVVDGEFTPPFKSGDGTSDKANAQLAALRRREVGVPGKNAYNLRTHYYGLVDNYGGRYFMRGSAMAIPGTASPETPAAGPTGSPGIGGYAWDTDMSWGDWYGAHELGHTFGRSHPGFPTGKQDASDKTFPYPNGQISTEDDDFVGFDVGDPSLGLPMQALPGRTYHDFMTYCEKQWSSAHTYEAIRKRLLEYDKKFPSNAPRAAKPGVASGTSSAAAPSGESDATMSDVVHVVASVDVTAGTGSIRYVNPARASVGEAGMTPGTGSGCELTTHDAHGVLLSRVTPAILVDGCGGGMEQAGTSATRTGLISQQIPLLSGMTEIRLLVGGNQVAQHLAGALGTVPASGIELDPMRTDGPGERRLMSDGAFRLPGISYTVQGRSATGDGEWQTIAVGRDIPDVDIDLNQFPAAERIAVRVIATDGFADREVASREIVVGA